MTVGVFVLTVCGTAVQSCVRAWQRGCQQPAASPTQARLGRCFCRAVAEAAWSPSRHTVFVLRNLCWSQYRYLIERSVPPPLCRSVPPDLRTVPLHLTPRGSVPRLRR